MKRKLISALLCLCMVLTLLPMAAMAADFTDTEDTWDEAQTAIDRWAGEGIIDGKGDGKFAPNDGMTRAEFGKTVAELMKLKGEADLSAFTDVVANEWYVPYLKAVKAAGIMNGDSATTMSPDGELSREAMFVMIARALGVEEAETSNKTIPDIDDAGDWSKGYINALVNMGVLNGVDALGSVDPATFINRASAVTVLDRLIGGYGNEDGDEVTIVPGKITLIVADNVTVKGEADPELPIIITGESKKVDMKEVEGAAKVQVNVSDVTITNAPEGTEIKADKTVSGVTANGIDVSGDADNDVVIPEKKPSIPSGYVPPLSDTTTADTIDGIIEQGRQDVNAKMIVKTDQAGQPVSPYPYAFIPDIDNSGATRAVTVNIYDGNVLVGTVYTDIINTLVDALSKNSDKVTSITATTPIEGADLPEGGDGTQYKTTLALTDNVLPTDVVLFVKALVGIDYGRGSDIGSLVGDSFTVTVSDAGKDEVPTDISYTVTFAAPTLDEVIGARIGSIGAKMDYASLTWTEDDHTLTVNITNGQTQLGKVYTDIGDMLCNAFNAARTNIKSVEDSLFPSEGGGTKASLTEKLDKDLERNDLHEFVKNLYITKNDGSDTKQLLNLLSSSSATIDALNGYKFVIDVTTTAEGAVAEPYTITFTTSTPSLDTVIESEIETIDDTMEYAELEWTTDTHTLAVTINNGNTPIGTVYNDIAAGLCSAFNKCRTTLSSVEDKLYPSDGGSQGKGKSTLSPSQDALTEQSLFNFVSGLYLKKGDGETAVSLLDVMADTDADATRQSLISHLDGYHFEIDVTATGEGAKPVTYTISFTVTSPAPAAE